MSTNAERFIDLQGQTFSRLTVLRYAGRYDGVASCWECRCVCGTVKVIRGAYLRNGRIKSCTCLKQEIEEGHRERRQTDETTTAVVKGRDDNPAGTSAGTSLWADGEAAGSDYVCHQEQDAPV